MSDKKSWSDLSPRQRVVTVVAGLVELVLTFIALRDLKRRPRDLVRGPKPVWALVCTVQPVGPIAYLVAGRRGSAE
jgi:hypothetical protein